MHQYNISDTANPKLVGQVSLGGALRKGGGVSEKGGKQREVVKVKVSGTGELGLGCKRR